MLTFETDRFLTYAIVYNEADVDTTPHTDVTLDITPDTGVDEGEKDPIAGDSSHVGFYMVVVALAAVVVFMRKKVANV